MLITHHLPQLVANEEQSIQERKSYEVVACTCFHMNVILIQYCQGRPKERQDHESLSNVNVGFLVGLHHTYHSEADHD